MTHMTAAHRVLATLAGQQVDRPPVSFWHHFPPAAVFGPPAVDAHLKHLQRYELDFLKVMNDNAYPTRSSIRSAADLRNVPVLRGDEDAYVRQIDLIHTLAEALGERTLLITTIFNAWTVLRRIATPPTDARRRAPVVSAPASPADARMEELIAEDRTAVGMALDVVAMSQAKFAKQCIEAGADGIFLSVRDDHVDTPANGASTYDEMVRLGDGQILTAARGGRFNMLHVCGVPRNFDAFADYPVHAINWADRTAGPAIRDVVAKIDPVVCGGVDNLTTLATGSPKDVEGEVRDALEQSGERPTIISAGCTYDPDVVPPANLEAMVRATRTPGDQA